MNEKPVPPCVHKVQHWRTPKRELIDQSLPIETQTLTAETSHLLQERMDFQAILKEIQHGLSTQIPATLQKAILDYLPSKKHNLNTECLHFPNH